MTGAERREQLIDVGRVVFAERGYEATSVEEIADRADVSKPVIYEHFGGKEGLYAVIVDREVADLTTRMIEAIAVDHPRMAAEQSALAFLGYIEEHQDGFRILVHDSPSGLGGGSLGSVMADVALRVEDLLGQHFKQQGYDKAAVPMYARMLVGAVTLVGEWWLETGKPSRTKVAAHLVNLMWNGLKDLEAKPDLRVAAAKAPA